MSNSTLKYIGKRLVISLITRYFNGIIFNG